MITHHVTTYDEYFFPARKYSAIIVKKTVVRLKVVYIGTLIPRIDSIDTSCRKKKESVADLLKKQPKRQEEKLHSKKT